MTIQLLLLTIIITAGCSQSEKPTAATKSNTEAKKKIETPNVDIQTAVITGNLEAVKQHIKAGTDLNQKEQMSSATPFGP